MFIFSHCFFLSELSTASGLGFLLPSVAPLSLLGWPASEILSYEIEDDISAFESSA